MILHPPRAYDSLTGEIALRHLTLLFTHEVTQAAVCVALHSDHTHLQTDSSTFPLQAPSSSLVFAHTYNNSLLVVMVNLPQPSAPRVPIHNLYEFMGANVEAGDGPTKRTRYVQLI